MKNLWWTRSWKSVFCVISRKLANQSFNGHQDKLDNARDGCPFPQSAKWKITTFYKQNPLPTSFSKLQNQIFMTKYLQIRRAHYLCQLLKVGTWLFILNILVPTTFEAKRKTWTEWTYKSVFCPEIQKCVVFSRKIWPIQWQKIIKITVLKIKNRHPAADLFSKCWKHGFCSKNLQNR